MKKRLMFGIIAAAVLLVLLAGCGLIRRGLILSYGKTRGKPRTYKQRTVGELTTTVGRKTARTELESEIVFAETVSASEKSGEIEKRIVYELGWIKAGGKRTDFSIKGKVAVIRMDKSGRVIETKGLAELLAGQRNPLDLRRTLEENQLVFSSKPVKVGETWTYDKKFKLANIGERALKSKAKLAGLAEKEKPATATIESTFEGKISGERKVSGTIFLLEGAEKGKATTRFDLEEKAIIKHQSTIKGAFEVSPLGTVTPQTQPLKTAYGLTTTITYLPEGI